jgi:hypothetical protein
LFSRAADLAKNAIPESSAAGNAREALFFSLST